MANNTNDYLVDMLVPSLDEPGFAHNVDAAFEQIKTNFSILANQDFVKGETGDSSNLQIEPLMVDYSGNGDPYLTAYGYNVLNAIYPGGIKLKSDSTATEFPIAWSSFNKFEEDIYAPVSVTIETTNNTVETKTYHWYSQFEALNEDGSFGAGNVYVISKRNGNESIEEATPYSSLYYTFLDYRFYNENVGTIGEDTYEQLEDMSCVLMLNAEQNGYSFKKYDAFPTMYYEDNTGLCWRINGSKTGMPVRGIPGADGKNAVLHIVKAAKTEDEDKCKITDIFDNGFKPLTDINIIKSLAGQSSIVFVLSTVKNNFYFSKMYLDDSSENENDWYLYAYCNEDNALNTQIAYNEFINVLKAINLYKTDTDTITTLKGLFIPIETVSSDDTNDNDLIEGEDEQTNSVTQAVHLITAVTNFDGGSADSVKQNMLFTAVDDINTTEENAYKMYVDTYLYLEYDKSLIAADSDKDAEYTACNDGWGDPKTHALKYKLSNYITSTDTIATLLHKDTFPDHLRDAITSSGIYQWTLNIEKNEYYDVDELKNQSENTYTFDDVFGPIYTTSSTPGVDSEFNWYCPYNNYENTDESGNQHPGWTNKKFIFKKLVPICINNNVYQHDTTLNLNYNVNILGDNNSNGSHNLTVHGNISSNSANIYGSLSANDYKNIYTSNIIKGDDGIELGKITKIIGKDNIESSPAFTIDANGRITKSTSITTNNIVTENIESNGSITANNVSCNAFKLAHEGNIGISAEIISNSINNDIENEYLNDTSNISINNTNNIKITKNTKIADIAIEALSNTITSDAIPHINSDMPLMLNNNANIVITNATDINDVYVDYSNTGSLPLHFRAVDTSNKKKTIDFNSAKDYNLYKITNATNTNTVQGKDEFDSGISKNSISYPVSGHTSDWEDGDDGIFNVTNSGASNLTSWKIAQFDITKKTASDTLTNNIKFNLSEYLLKINIYGRCSYGRWPRLIDGSNIVLKYFYKLSTDSTINELCTDSTTYKFSNINTDWCGINHVSGEYSGKDRYYYYKFSPKSYICYTSSKPFRTLRAAFDNLPQGQTLTIYAIPIITVKAQSENWRNTIKSLKVEGFTFNNTSSKTESATISCTTLKNYPSSANYVNPSCDYYITSSTNDSVYKATTICDNGIVFTSGNYVFGLGYGENIYDHSKNKYYTKDDTSTSIWGTGAVDKTSVSIDGTPMLFYADATKEGVSSWVESINKTLANSKDKKLINFAYNRAINAIPLKDIFNAIYLLRSSNDSQSWSSYGL
jgi:hypothetical protein